MIAQPIELHSDGSQLPATARALSPLASSTSNSGNVCSTSDLACRMSQSRDCDPALFIEDQPITFTGCNSHHGSIFSLRYPGALSTPINRDPPYITLPLAYERTLVANISSAASMLWTAVHKAAHCRNEGLQPAPEAVVSRFLALPASSGSPPLAAWGSNMSLYSSASKQAVVAFLSLRIRP